MRSATQVVVVLMVENHSDDDKTGRSHPNS